MQPETIILVKQNVTQTIFGFPVSPQDIVLRNVIWLKTQVVNDDFKLDVRTEFNRSVIQANIDFDYTERQFFLHFYSIMDILSTLGGLRASILPILQNFVPLMVLHFLWSLAGIIYDSTQRQRQTELLRFVKAAKRQFLLIDRAHQANQVILSRR